MKETKIKARHARRGGTLVIGIPDLQLTFDNLRSGGALLLESFGAEMTGGVRQVVLVAESRLNEILHEVQDSSNIDRSSLN